MRLCVVTKNFKPIIGHNQLFQGIKHIFTPLQLDMVEEDYGKESIHYLFHGHITNIFDVNYKLSTIFNEQKEKKNDEHI